MRLALLGDSIAYGMGAARREDSLEARLVRGLVARGHDAISRVLASPGARSSALAGQVDRALDWDPDIAVMVIGANDLTHFEPVQSAAGALREAVARLRAAGVDVVIAPAPDLSSVPHVPVPLRDVVREVSERLRREQVAIALAEGAHVADADGATSRAFAADPSLFSADRFHPSSAGYAVIAEALLPQVIAAATRKASGSTHW